MRDFIITLIICSSTMSAVILAYMAITPLLTKRYQVKWRYYAWLIIVFGLIIPFRPQFNNAIVKVDTQSEISAPVIQIGNAAPITIPFINTEPMETLQYDAPAPASVNISLWQAAAMAWLAGVIYLIAYHAIKHYRFSKMAKRWSEKITDVQTVALFQRLREEMKISKHIGLYRCSSIGSPMLVGFIKPRILFPKCDFDQDELGFILKHELVHYKRKDLLYKSLVLVASIIHWFNPIVYLMAKAIDMQCELSCDDAVIKHTNQYVRQQYSETIIGVVKFKSKMTTALSTNYCGGVKGMKKRILSILDTAPKKTGAVILCVALLLIAISGSFIMVTKIISNDLEKNLNLLKSGDTKPLVGFAIGDPIDYELVEDTGEYRGGGRVSNLKSGKYSDIYLFFSETTNRLEAIGANVEDTSNFFGITLGQTNLQTITDILGQPDVYNEISDMWSTPEATYYFEKGALYLNTDSEYKIIRITYNSIIHSRSVEEVINETEEQAADRTWENFAVSMKESGFIPAMIVDALPDFKKEIKDEDLNSYIWSAWNESDDIYLHYMQITATDRLTFYHYKNYDFDTPILDVALTRDEAEVMIKQFIRNYAPNIAQLSFVNKPAYYSLYDPGHVESWVADDPSGGEHVVMVDLDMGGVIFYALLTPSGNGTVEQAAEKTATLYVNDKLAFSIEFPADWEGLYEIAENYIERDMRGGAGITVYQKATHDLNPSLGELFYLERWIGTYTPESPPIWAGTCAVTLNEGKYTYMIRTPSDVRYIVNDRSIADEYNRMFDQLDIILSNVKFIEDTYYSYYADDPAEKEFLSSEEGEQLRSTAYKASIAYLKADTGELGKYMLNPDEASRAIRNQTNIYDDLVWLCYKYTDNERSDGKIIVSYEYLLQGEDSYTYITTSMEKADGVWMVSFIAGEK